MNVRIQTIKNLYRVDDHRLHLTGLSHGGWCSNMFVTADALGGPYNYASQIASVVEVEGVQPSDNAPYPNLIDNFALSGGRLLAFEQLLDFRDARTRVNRMNSTRANSGIYVQTLFGTGGHCCWSNFYGGGGTAPGIFTLDGTLQNLYQWMARQALPEANTPPVVTAGNDQTITLPLNSTTLYGSSSESGSNVFQWSKASGPTAGSISNPSAAQTTVTGLTEGIYKFALNVTDSRGVSSGDTVTVTVKAPVPAAAGSITGPTNACILMPAQANGNGTPGTYKIRKINYAGSYNWTAPAGTSIVSHPAGTGTNDTVVVIKFTSSFTSGNISVTATSSAGTGPVTNLVITKTLPATPGAIRGAADICELAGRKITYSISPSANATSYQWTVPTGANITGGNGTDTAISVQFRSNFVSGTISVKAFNACGNSTGSSSLAISNQPPATPGNISGSANVCTAVLNNSTLRYSIQAVPLATSYVWTVTGGATIAGGQGTSAIDIRFPAGFTTGLLSVAAARTCGQSAAKTLTLNKLAPATPGTIMASGTPCTGVAGNITYSVAEVANASSYVWTVPTNAGIVSGQETNRLVVNFRNTFTSGNVQVKAVSACGTSAAQTLAVTPTKQCPKAGIVVGRASQQGAAATTASIIPNPNTGVYQLLIQSVASPSPVKIEVRNMYGVLVYETVVKNKTGNITVPVNTPGLTRGVYNVAYIIDGTYHALKMLIEK